VNAAGALTRDVSLARVLAAHARTLTDADPTTVNKAGSESAAVVAKTVQERHRRLQR